ARRMPADEKLEGHLCPLESEAVGLEALDQQAEGLRIDAVELVAELLGPQLRVRLAAELRNDEARHVADERRFYVLIAALDLGHRRAMDAALVGERRSPDVRLMVVRDDVDDLGDVPAELGEVGETPGGGVGAGHDRVL